jgi:hypothetical protein
VEGFIWSFGKVSPSKILSKQENFSWNYRYSIKNVMEIIGENGHTLFR